MKPLVLILSCAWGLMAGAEPTEAKDVTTAMESLKQAMLSKDGAALDKLLGDDLSYIHSAGQHETKEEFIRAIVSGKSIVQRLDLMATQVRVYGNTALFQGNVDLYHSPTDIVHMNVLHVWVKSAGGWKMVARQATKLVLPAKK